MNVQWDSLLLAVKKYPYELLMQKAMCLATIGSLEEIKGLQLIARKKAGPKEMNFANNLKELLASGLFPRRASR